MTPKPTPVYVTIITANASNRSRIGIVTRSPTRAIGVRMETPMCCSGEVQKWVLDKRVARTTSSNPDVMRKELDCGRG
jgi:hypothetical protein